MYQLPVTSESVTHFVNSASSFEIEQQVRKYRRGMVNSLLEYLILNCLEKGKMCGYDIITLLHERFHTLLSPGQVYPVIDDMTEHGLIYKEKQGRAVMLMPSHLGESLLKAWREEFTSIQMQLNNLATGEIHALSCNARELSTI
jgi:DNA-binding PadR family transcriptional regulator